MRHIYVGWLAHTHVDTHVDTVWVVGTHTCLQSAREGLVHSASEAYLCRVVGTHTNMLSNVFVSIQVDVVQQ